MLTKPGWNETAAKKRGKIIAADIAIQFTTYLDQDLIKQLMDHDPQVRTAAAKILGERKSIIAIPALCSQFSREKALYAKIAISNALSTIGIAALPELTKYVGKIGINQYRDLPKDIFKKWNYPLPRDVAIRSIIRMGPSALVELNQCLFYNDKPVVNEIIDAIGHISFYSRDRSSFNNLMKVLSEHQSNRIIVWKTLRALQAFPNSETLQVLKHFLVNGEIPQFRWEAARSLGQIATKAAEECLKMAKSDSDDRVRAMLDLSMAHIHDSVHKTNKETDIDVKLQDNCNQKNVESGFSQRALPV
jgi:FOG: HEAT repeat